MLIDGDSSIAFAVDAFPSSEHGPYLGTIDWHAIRPVLSRYRHHWTARYANQVQLRRPLEGPNPAKAAVTVAAVSIFSTFTPA